MTSPRCRAASHGIVAIAVLACTAWSFTGCPGESSSAEPEYRHASSEHMGTTIEALLPAGERFDASAEAVSEVFRRVDERMSEWKESSPLSTINRHAGRRPVSVPEDLYCVVKRALVLGDLTGGAFDVTWAALWGLWDFKSEELRVPDSSEIRARARLVDYRKIVVDDSARSVFLPAAGMKIGLGGIAKGYALDLAADTLREMGIGSFLLSAGGQVYAAGKRGDRPWRVGIRDPRGAVDDYFAFLEVEDLSVSTSGDYESYFIADGRRYHHILDPRTGWPARGLRSATVLSSDATLADALSTAFMVMGSDAALDLAERLADVEAVLVDEEGGVYSTAGVRNRLVMRHKAR